MRKKWKIGIWVGVGLFALFFAVVLVASPVLENKIKKSIAEQLPQHVQLNAYELSVSVISGSLEIENLEFSPKRTVSDSLPKQFVSVDKVSIAGFNYFRFLFNNEIKLKEITVENPVIQLDKTTEFQTAFKNNSNENLRPSLFIDQFLIKGMEVVLYERDTLPYLKLTQGDFTFRRIEVDKQSLRCKIPFRYESYEVETSSFLVWLNEFDLLAMSSMEVSNGQFLVQDFSIKTQYNKEVLSTKIKKERDYVDLSIPEIRAYDFDLTQQRDSLLVLINKLHFKEPQAEVYRDKRIVDDYSEKPLYSKSLRSLPFLLSIDTVFLEKAAVTYEEKIHSDRPAGMVSFSNLEADISHLSNVYDQEKPITETRINAIFMDKTPIDVTWEFDVLNPEDAFVFKAKLGKLEAAALNSFTKSNLNIVLEGVLDETYFTIDANNIDSSIDMRLKYEDFKVEVLNKEDRKNKFLSAVANLFVKKESSKENHGFKNGSATAKRNIDRSVFNYLWVNIEAGLKNVILEV